MSLPLIEQEATKKTKMLQFRFLRSLLFDWALADAKTTAANAQQAQQTAERVPQEAEAEVAKGRI